MYVQCIVCVFVMRVSLESSGGWSEHRLAGKQALNLNKTSYNKTKLQYGLVQIHLLLQHSSLSSMFIFLRAHGIRPVSLCLISASGLSLSVVLRHTLLA